MVKKANERKLCCFIRTRFHFFLFVVLWLFVCGFTVDLRRAAICEDEGLWVCCERVLFLFFFMMKKQQGRRLIEGEKRGSHKKSTRGGGTKRSRRRKKREETKKKEKKKNKKKKGQTKRSGRSLFHHQDHLLGGMRRVSITVTTTVSIPTSITITVIITVSVVPTSVSISVSTTISVPITVVITVPSTTVSAVPTTIIVSSTTIIVAASVTRAVVIRVTTTTVRVIIIETASAFTVSDAVGLALDMKRRRVVVVLCMEEVETVSDEFVAHVDLSSKVVGEAFVAISDAEEEAAHVAGDELLLLVQTGLTSQLTDQGQRITRVEERDGC